MTPEQSLAFIGAMRAALKPGARRVLVEMLEAEERDDLGAAEIVYTKNQVWVGDRRTSTAVLKDLNCAVLLRAETKIGADPERYKLNGEGRAVAKAEREARMAS